MYAQVLNTAAHLLHCFHSSAASALLYFIAHCTLFAEKSSPLRVRSDKNRIEVS